MRVSEPVPLLHQLQLTEEWAWHPAWAAQLSYCWGLKRASPEGMRGGELTLCPPHIPQESGGRALYLAWAKK